MKIIYLLLACSVCFGCSAQINSNDDIAPLCNAALDDFTKEMEWLKKQPLILAKRTKDGFIQPDKIVAEHFQKKELKIIPFKESNLENQKDNTMVPKILKTGESAFVIYYEEPLFLSPEQIEIKVGYYGGPKSGGGTGKLFRRENGTWILKDRFHGGAWIS